MVNRFNQRRHPADWGLFLFLALFVCLSISWCSPPLIAGWVMIVTRLPQERKKICGQVVKFGLTIYNHGSNR